MVNSENSVEFISNPQLLLGKASQSVIVGNLVRSTIKAK